MNDGFESRPKKCFRASLTSLAEGVFIVSIRSFGKVVFDPKSNCAGDTPLERFGVFLHPSKTIGSDRVQPCVVERMRSEVLRVM